MTIDLAGIKRMKAELRRDLDALERVEALFARQPSDQDNSPHHPAAPTLTSTAKLKSRAALRDVVTQILQQSRKPLRPTEIVEIAAERGYPFASLRKGMGTVTSVLHRYKGKGIQKLDDGTYIWKE
jgi:hypothetical protein